MRLVIYELVYYLIPVIVCLVLYIKIGKVLFKMKDNTNRKKRITIIFIVSWAVWAILWAPLFAFNVYKAHAEIFFKESNKTDGYYIEQMLVDVELIKNLFSAVNPILFIFVCTPFKQSVKKWFKCGMEKFQRKATADDENH